MRDGTRFRTAFYLSILLFAVATAVGCSSQSEQPVDPEVTDVPEVTDGEVKEFNVMAKSWEFDPSTITVNKGDTVRLSVESIDVRHGITIPEFRINEVLEPGSKVEIEFVADKAGTFDFSCSVPCGSGHRQMKGTLVVNE